MAVIELPDEPTRVEWAVACVYNDKEIRTREVDDEAEASSEADRVTAEAIGAGWSDSMPVAAYPARRRVWDLPGYTVVEQWHVVVRR